MAEIEIVKIIQRRALKAELPTLDEGELGFATDTKELFIGSNTGNILIANKSDIPPTGTTVTGSSTNGNILVDGVELQVYDDSLLQQVLNNKADTGHTHSLEDLIDVDVANKIDGHVLQYNAEAGEFILQALPAGSGSGVTSLNGLSDVDVSTVPPVEGDVLTFEGGQWGPKGYTSSSSSRNTTYKIDINEWGITEGIPAKPYTDNNYYMADANIQGINGAIQYAYENGYSEVMLPRGEYAVCYPNPIVMKTGITFNLNRSTLKVIYDSERQSPLDPADRSETKDYYNFGGNTIVMENVTNSHVVNGTIIGCRTERSYTNANEVAVEWTYGVLIGKGTSFSSVKHCEIKDYMGDNISISSSAPYTYAEFGMGLQLGRIDRSTGNVVNDSENTLVSSFLPLQPGYSTFMIAGFGYTRQTALITKEFGVYFYDNQGEYIGGYDKRKIYDDISIPLEATKIRLVFYHETNINKNMQITLKFGGIPHHNVIEFCVITGGHRGGITGGGSYNVIQHNVIKDNGRASTSFLDGKPIFNDPTRYSINQEDSYGDNIVIRNNYISGSYHGILVGCYSVFIENNHIYNIDYIAVNLYSLQYALVSGNYMYNNDQNIGLMNAHLPNAHVEISSNSFHKGSLKLNGDNGGYQVTATNNHICDPTMLLVGKDGVFRNNVIQFINRGDLSGTRVEIEKMNGCLFESKVNQQDLNIFSQGFDYDRCKFKNIRFYVQSASDKVKDSLTNCEFIDSTIVLTNYNSNRKARILTISECKLVNTTMQLIAIGTPNQTHVLHVQDSDILVNSDAISHLFKTDINSTKGGVIDITNCNITLSKPINEIIKFVSRFHDDSVTFSIKNSRTSYTGATLLNLNYYSDVNPVVKFISAKNKFENILLPTEDPDVFIGYDPETHSEGEPSSGYFHVGSMIKNAFPIAGGFLGWICLKEGYANDNPWQPSTTYVVGSVIHANNKVYRCSVAGTSGTTAPSHDQTTRYATDGTVTWEYIGDLVFFKRYGVIYE